VNGNLAILESGQFALIVIHQNYVMAEVGKAGACHQTYVSGTDNSDLHIQNSSSELADSNILL
jgi:hypothetical protein